MTGIYGDFFDLIVSPGDSVYVTIDAGRMRAGDPDAIRFSGDHARTNNALASVAGLKRRLCEQAPAVEGDPQEYLASYRRYRQAVADSLSARRLPAEVREAVARDIDMVQIWNHDLDPAAWRAIFTDPMFDIFDLERNMVSVINYSAGISYYLGAICPDEIEAVRSGAAPAEALAAVAARLDADPQIGRGLRDYLLYGCMEGMRANGAVPAERMAGLFLDPAYAARVRERAAERPAFSTVPLSGVLRCDAAGRIDTLPDCELLSMLAARHPGKALYVDFCSTWCGPCRSELKTAMPILREHYAGSDEVRFVTLCLQSRRKAWVEFLDDGAGRELFPARCGFFADAGRIRPVRFSDLYAHCARRTARDVRCTASLAVRSGDGGDRRPAGRKRGARRRKVKIIRCGVLIIRGKSLSLPRYLAIN